MSNPSEAVLSYSKKIVPPWWARQLLKPIGWPNTLLGLLLLWLVWEARIPDSSIDSFIGALLIFIPFGLVWLLRLVLRIILQPSIGTAQLSHRGGWRFLIPVALALLTWILLAADLPFGSRGESASLPCATCQKLSSPAKALPSCPAPPSIPIDGAASLRWNPSFIGQRVAYGPILCRSRGIWGPDRFRLQPTRKRPSPPASPASNTPTASCTPMEGPWYLAIESR